jgi:hypothetical protein
MDGGEEEAKKHEEEASARAKARLRLVGWMGLSGRASWERLGRERIVEGEVCCGRERREGGEREEWKWWMADSRVGGTVERAAAEGLVEGDDGDGRTWLE